MYLFLISIKTKLEKEFIKKRLCVDHSPIFFNLFFFFFPTYADTINTFRSPIPQGGGLSHFFRHTDLVNRMSTIVYRAIKLFFKNTTKTSFSRDEHNTP